MATRTSITESIGIPEILDLIHDCWFDVDEIEFDRGMAEIVIPFRRRLREHARVVRGIWPFRRREIPIVRAYLRIHHVEDYHLSDTNRVGMYDFNDLEYHERSGRLRITTGIPMDLEVKVRSLQLSVEITDNVVDVSSSSALLG